MSRKASKPYSADRLAKLAMARQQPRKVTPEFREMRRQSMIKRQPELEAGKRRAREAKLAARKAAELARTRITTDDAINLYRSEKAAAELRQRSKFDEAKAAYARRWYCSDNGGVWNIGDTDPPSEMDRQ